MNPPRNRANALAALTLATVSGVLIISSTGWLAKISGCLSGITAISIHQRKKLSGGDYSDATDFLAGEIGESLGALAIAPSLPKLPTKLMLKTLPPKYRSTAEALMDTYTETDWLKDALRKGLIVCGDTGDGKSTFLNYLIAYLLKEDPETELTIIDPDYGSSHGDGPPNTWMGLPVGHVVITDEDVGVQVFVAAAHEVARRAKATTEALTNGADRKPFFKSRMIVADEALEILQANFDSGDDDFDFDKANSRILFRGLKQKVRPVWGVHSLLCKQLRLDETQINQVNIIVLGKAATNKQNLNKLGITGARADETINQIKAVRKMPGCKWACLVRIDGEVSIRALPDIDISTLTIATPTEQDPLQQWWSTTATEPVVDQAKDLITANPGAAKTRLAVMKLLGLEEQQCRKGRKDHDKYQHFKAQYDQWTKEVTIALQGPPPDPTPVVDADTEVMIQDGLIFTGEDLKEASV
jgi:hypothetical protein